MVDFKTFTKKIKLYIVTQQDNYEDILDKSENTDDDLRFFYGGLSSLYNLDKLLFNVEHFDNNVLSELYFYEEHFKSEVLRYSELMNSKSGGEDLHNGIAFEIGCVKSHIEKLKLALDV